MSKFDSLVEGLNQKERGFVFFKSLLDSEEKEFLSNAEKLFARACIYKHLGPKTTNPIKMFCEYKLVEGLVNQSAIKAKEYEKHLDDDSYQIIVAQTKSLAKELNCTDPLMICNLYSCLLWNGYFSLGKKFRCGNDNAVDCIEYSSHSIMSGVGNNLAISSMLRDILDLSGVTNAEILGENKQSVPTGYSPPFERCGYKEFLNGNNKGIKKAFFGTMLGNYFANLIVDAKGGYLYDPMSFNLCSIEDMSTALGVTGWGDIKIKPFLSFAFNDTKNLEALGT